MSPFSSYASMLPRGTCHLDLGVLGGVVLWCVEAPGGECCLLAGDEAVRGSEVHPEEVSLMPWQARHLSIDDKIPEVRPAARPAASATASPAERLTASIAT